jgi:hypothetical protein
MSAKLFFVYFVKRKRGKRRTVKKYIRPMRKLIYLLAIAPFILLSCGGGNADGEENNENSDTLQMQFEDMTEFSLKPDGLNMQVMLPEVASSTGNSIDPSVQHDEGDYLWYLSIGPRFKLIIEDFGKEMNKVAGEKERLSELENIFEIEYLVDEPKLIMYKRSLHEGHGGKVSYHCYGEVEIDGYNYVIRNEDEGSLRPIAEDMVKTIRSAAPIAGA